MVDFMKGNTAQNPDAALEFIVKCKMISEGLNLTNIIIDDICVDEKELLVRLIQMIKNLELEIIEIQTTPEAQA